MDSLTSRVRVALLLGVVAGCAESTSTTRSVADVASDAATDTLADARIVIDAAPIDGATTDADAGVETEDAGIPEAFEVRVTLDGEPVGGVKVVQGGVFMRRWRTDESGIAVVQPDFNVAGGDVFIMASHPEARIMGVDPRSDPWPLTIELTRYDVTDNPEYKFNDPGVPGRRGTTAQCGHCHRSINDQWSESVHAQSASNPFLHDLYAGVAHTLDTETACVEAGGRWFEGLEPGTRQPRFRCYLGDGYLPSRNPSCRDTSCDRTATRLGPCADCHAPGIDGALGGRGLLEATELAYDYGVHCDVCHRVESIDLDADPGVAGRLSLLRPSEPASFSLGSGGWLPLTFGPSPDSPNPRMGSVERGHFRESRFCAGCHELTQDDFPSGQQPNAQRWPGGVIPVQSTFSEWQAGPMADSAPCQSCHMPPDPTAGNHADIHLYVNAVVGFVGGWFRPPGSTRKHTWPGPRATDRRMLAHAAAVFVDKTVEGDRVRATATVKNVGAGHAVPTGEPLRHLLLSVRARCGNIELPVIEAPTVPDYGGYRARKQAGEDWSRWPDAEAGDRVRVVRRPGEFVEYEGVGPFGDGRFSTPQKGLPRTTFVQEATVLAVDVAGVATFDRALEAGDEAYLVRGDDDWAGRPGFGFARVMADARGQTMVPHFLAVDVVSDNRLLPQQAFTTTYTFETTCLDPQVEAELVYRRFPVRLARQRRWPLQTEPMTRGSR